MNRRQLVGSSLGWGVALGAARGASAFQPVRDLTFWLETGLRRVYPGSPVGTAKSLRLRAARGERVSFQVCVRSPGMKTVEPVVSVDAAGGLAASVRRVGYVAQNHLNTETPESQQEGLGYVPGLVPDPLFVDARATMGPHENQSFWISVDVPPDAGPGAHDLAVKIRVGKEQKAELRATVDVSPVVLRPRKDFPVAHWFSMDALCGWYKVDPYEESAWAVVEPYMRNLAAHGGDCQHIPLFTPPTDGVKRPIQLLRVREPSPGKYQFDFSDVRRWTTLAQRCGAHTFEFPHLFTQWGVKHPLRVYRTNADPKSLLWPAETLATAPVFRNFLAQLLPELQRFLAAEGLLQRSFFHVSDEPSGEQQLESYRKARQMLRELAPWLKVLESAEVRYAKMGIVDTPIALPDQAKDYAAEKIPHWIAFACCQRGTYLNRLHDTPLPKIRMAGWLFYKLRALGFLHWGYNWWYNDLRNKHVIDPFKEPVRDGWPGSPSGDPFVVYPGEKGPIDSIRWEVWAESLQDYALLQTLGVSPDDGSLADLKGYGDFPANAPWIDRRRAALLQRKQRKPS